MIFEEDGRVGERVNIFYGIKNLPSIQIQ